MKKYLILILALLMTLSLFAGCGTPVESDEVAEEEEETAEVTEEAEQEEAEQEAEQEEEEDEGYLKLEWEYINETKDGFQPTNFMGNYIETNLIWDTLVRIVPETGEMVYLLAEDIIPNEDYSMYTVKLKQGVVWHDGTPFTAEDVVFTYNTVVSDGKNSSYASLVKGYQEVLDGTADSMEGLYATDEYTVVLELSEPSKSYLMPANTCLFAHGCFSILPKHLLEGVEKGSLAIADYWRNPVGTGPYMVSETSYPEYSTLVRFDDYHGEAAGIKNIMLTAYNDREAALAAAMAGDLDLMRSVALADAENVAAQNSDCEVAIHAASYCRGIMPNAQNDAKDHIFQNAEIRKAFNLIIDKQTIADYYGVYVTPATTLTNDFEYNDDIPVWQRDAEKGRQMLEAEGFDFSKKLTILTYYTDQATVDVFDIIVANLAEVGIEAEYTTDGSTAADQWNIGEFDFYYYAGASYQYFGSDRDGEYHFDDYDYEHREEYTELWLEYSNTLDPNEKKRILGELQLIFMQDMYIVPLFFMNTVYNVNSAHLQGYKGRSTDFEAYGYLGVENWTLAK